MLYFVRHGESEANVRQVFAGSRDDSLLTDKGRQQARECARKIKEENITINLIVASSLKRSQETATIIANELGIDPATIKTDDRIIEYDMGSLSGTPNTHISSELLTSAKDGEPIEHFKERVQESTQELARFPGNVLMVSHGGVGRAVQAIRDGIEPKHFYDVPVWPNACVIKLDWIT